MIQTIVCTPAVIAEEKVPAVVNIIETVESVDSSSSSISPDEQNDAIDTINDLLLDRLKKIPEEPLVGYPASTRGAGDYVYYTAKDLDRFTDCAVYDLIAQGLKINVRTHHIKNYQSYTHRHIQDTEANKTVALLGPSNLDYVTSIFALSRMGYGVLLLSTRLATDAYVSLLEKTSCFDIVYTSSTAKSLPAIQDVRKCNTFTIPEKSKYDATRPIDFSSIPIKTSASSSKIAFIIHSSGSTGLPKPIFQTHKACLSNYATGSGYRAFLTLPLYHNHGLSTFFRAICKGKPISLYNASLPLGETNLVSAMEAVQPESFHGVPYALKLLSGSERGIEALRRCKLVLFGGSSCPQDLGDKLVNAGVYLVSHYGA
jgi:acyl-CoA synthetase (AMP-forming)/AMP-acid ligase II